MAHSSDFLSEGSSTLSFTPTVPVSEEGPFLVTIDWRLKFHADGQGAAPGEPVVSVLGGRVFDVHGNEASPDLMLFALMDPEFMTRLQAGAEADCLLNDDAHFAWHAENFAADESVDLYPEFPDF